MAKTTKRFKNEAKKENNIFFESQKNVSIYFFSLYNNNYRISGSCDRLCQKH